MRVCLKNTKTFWIVRPTGFTDKVDGDGYKTGERIPTYDSPFSTTLSFYQTGGTLLNTESGLAKEYEYIAFSSEDTLEENDLVFSTEPTSDYDVTYDFRVDKKINNLNSNRYGLVKRT